MHTPLTATAFPLRAHQGGEEVEREGGGVEDVRAKLGDHYDAEQVKEWVDLWHKEQRIAKGLKSACKALKLEKHDVKEWLKSSTNEA